MFYRGFVILGEAFFPFDFYQKDSKDNRDFTAGVWAVVETGAGRAAVAAVPASGSRGFTRRR